MPIWTPVIAGRTGPLYTTIVDALAADIAAGRMPAGTRLPPQRDLAFALKVTVGTIARAYAEAARRGLVSGEVGRGTYVRDPKTGAEPDMERLFQRDAADDDGVADMAINRPAGDGNAAAIAAALRELAAKPHLADLLTYDMGPGPARFRAAGAAWLGWHGLDIAPERIAITVGVQQAIMAAVAATTRPGDTVLAEDLTYPGLKTACALLDRRIEGLAMDEHGLIPDALTQALASRQGRVLYAMPSVHNPTTVTMPAARRAAIAEILRRHDGVLIEDGLYNFLSDHHEAPVSALIPERSFFLSGLTKNVAPALRTGYVAAPDAHSAARVAAQVAASTLMVPLLLVEIATTLVENGTAERSAHAQRAEVQARRRVAAGILGAPAVAGDNAFNLWLPLPPPWTSDAFVGAAYRRNVAVTPAASFVTGRHRPECVRVSLSAVPTHDDLRRALAVLSDLLGSSADALRTTV